MTHIEAGDCHRWWHDQDDFDEEHGDFILFDVLADQQGELSEIPHLGDVLGVIGTVLRCLPERGGGSNSRSNEPA